MVQCFAVCCCELTFENVCARAVEAQTLHRQHELENVHSTLAQTQKDDERARLRLRQLAQLQLQATHELEQTQVDIRTRQLHSRLI